jgi:hypothetical protein
VRDADGNWTIVPGRAQLNDDSNGTPFAVLSDDERRNAELPPGQWPPNPGSGLLTTPSPTDEERRRLNGTTTSPVPPGAVPPLGGFQTTPQTIDDLITDASRLPRSDGHWSGAPGDSNWTSTNSDVNVITGGKPITFRNGYPDLSEWAADTMIVEGLNGTASDYGVIYDVVADRYGLANRTAARDYLRYAGLSPHHFEDGRTIQLVPTALHRSIPHVGGASNLRNGG